MTYGGRAVTTVSSTWKPNLYPPPHLEDLSAHLASMTVFSKLDSRKGYYQVPVATQDVLKTGVITPFELFWFVLEDAIWFEKCWEILLAIHGPVVGGHHTCVGLYTVD